jgi:hypothetical protein
MENGAGTAMIFERNDEGEWRHVALLAPETVQWNSNFERLYQFQETWPL